MPIFFLMHLLTVFCHCWPSLAFQFSTLAIHWRRKIQSSLRETLHAPASIDLCHFLCSCVTQWLWAHLFSNQRYDLGHSGNLFRCACLLVFLLGVYDHHFRAGDLWNSVAALWNVNIGPFKKLLPQIFLHRSSSYSFQGRCCLGFCCFSVKFEHRPSFFSPEAWSGPYLVLPIQTVTVAFLNAFQPQQHYPDWPDSPWQSHW